MPGKNHYRTAPPVEASPVPTACLSLSVLSQPLRWPRTSDGGTRHALPSHLHQSVGLGAGAGRPASPVRAVAGDSSILPGLPHGMDIAFLRQWGGGQHATAPSPAELLGPLYWLSTASSLSILIPARSRQDQGGSEQRRNGVNEKWHGLRGVLHRHAPAVPKLTLTTARRTLF